MTPNRAKTVALSGIAVAVAAVGVGYFAASPSKAASEQAAAPKNDVPYLDGPLIRYSPDFAQRTGLKTAEAQNHEISPVIEVTGKATYDPKKFAIVGARIEGRVRAIYKYEGENVKPGDLLAELESAELGRAQAEVLKVRAREEAANADEARETRLAEAKVSSVRDAEAARATATAVRAERLAAENAVRALGGEVDTKDVGVLRIRSPIAGRVVRMLLSRGQMVDAQTSAFHVADLSGLWIDLDVFEQDVGAIRVGDKADIHPQAQANVKVEGVVAHVGDVIDEQTRSAMVRIEIANPDMALRPGQGVRAKIRATGPQARALSVPVEAVTRVDGKPTVFVARETNAVEVRKITLGSAGQSHVAVLNGLQEGEKVVTEGVFALKSEIFR